MRTYKLNGRKFRACNINCADSFKTDRRYGAIYGPYQKESGGFYLNAESASIDCDFCVYCSTYSNGGKV